MWYPSPPGIRSDLPLGFGGSGKVKTLPSVDDLLLYARNFPGDAIRALLEVKTLTQYTQNGFTVNFLTLPALKAWVRKLQIRDTKKKKKRGSFSQYPPKYFG